MGYFQTKIIILIYPLNLSASDKQADGGWRTIYIKLYYFCGLCLSFSFSFTFFPSVNDNSYLFRHKVKFSNRELEFIVMNRKCNVLQ